MLAVLHHRGVASWADAEQKHARGVEVRHRSVDEVDVDGVVELLFGSDHLLGVVRVVVVLTVVGM